MGMMGSSVIYKAFLFIILVQKQALGLRVELSINVSRAIFETDELSPSFAIGYGIFNHNVTNYLKTAKMMTLAGALGPCYLRLGGSRADFTTYDVEDTNPRDVNADEWDKLNTFLKCVDWKLLFGLNFYNMRKDEIWDPTNAEQLIKYSEARKYNVSWQLGNEPNSYRHKMGVPVPAEQLAAAYQVLKSVLQKYSKYKDALVVGPGTNDNCKLRGTDFMHKFMAVENGGVNRASIHQYYLNGRIAMIDNFTDYKIFNEFQPVAETVVQIIRKYNKEVPIWIEETSSGHGGGSPGISDTYANGFLWLDQLGIAAKTGISMVLRQSFIQGYYSVLDTYFNPLPDYWVTLLYKQLVGTKVLNVTMLEHQKQQRNLLNGRGRLRVYSHCANRKRYPSGAITVYFINLSRKSMLLKLTPPVSKQEKIAHVFALTPGENKITSRTILLNGKTLKMVDDQTLPTLNPEIITYKTTVNVPVKSKTFGFLVLPNINAKACRGI